MGFTLETGVSAAAVFLQGILSFFSPCVLPLVPLYIGYLAGGAKSVDADGTVRYKRGRVMRNTVFFVLGVSFTFFALGLGFTALGRFFSDNRALFARIGGVLIILFGLYQLGVFRSRALSTERRLPIRLDRLSMNPAVAFLFGFTFSFAWTPCVGPALGSVLLMAGSSATMGKGFFLIGVYTLGFVLPFIAVGLFTGAVLGFFKKYRNVVRYTVKISAVLLILMGFMTLTGFMNNMTGYLSGIGNGAVSSQETAADDEPKTPDGGTSSQAEENSGSESASRTDETGGSESAPSDPDAVPAPDFTLVDQYGNEHTLSDYKGKTVFLNFWATWCGPCRSEMPEIQALYEKYGENEEDLVVLGVATPNLGQEGSAEDIAAFLEDQGYTFPTVMDETGFISAMYGISAYPTTFMIDADGNVYGYVASALTGDIMESIVQQTMDSVTGEIKTEEE
mgnify:CR=1 FL=1